MLARSAPEAPSGAGWIYEPKLDGIRVIAYATPGGAALVTRNGNDKSRQFPEIVAALQELATRGGGDLVLDGEIVPLRTGGTPGRFQELQGRMHLADADLARVAARESPAAFYAFDLLAAGDALLVGEPWNARREQLEGALDASEGTLRITATSKALEAILRDAEREGWEGIMAKRIDAPYTPGRRSDAWLKVKLERQQEFVVGGWTEPRASRELLGALLVGHHEEGELRYAGSVGGGFDRSSLREVHRRLRPLERRTSPFADPPRTREPAHWVTPRLVVQVRFNEWTSAGRLRQPVFLGVRDDVNPREVVREP
jgi:bifunctional non-homologous end joining protein LigD